MIPPFPELPVLVVDDEPATLESVTAALELSGITNVITASDGAEARDLIRQKEFAAITLDLNIPKVPGLEILPLVLEHWPDTPVIVVTGSTELETAVHCLRDGAFDYLVKPVDRTRLVTSVRHAIERWNAAREISSLRDHLLTGELAHPEAFSAIVTRDPGMLAIFRYAEAIAPTPLPVLITGETGVGKELTARALHVLSGRSGAFVPVNVAGLDDTLFADTLFGHLKGAFTGAETAREGMVAKAEGGTLFLDEIGDLAPESQIKLLRLLQEREYHPLGADRPRTTTARFIFATNHDLTSTTATGGFRKDLLYRLRSHRIHIPPLRDRPGDIPILVDSILEKAAAAVGKKKPAPPKELYSVLRGYGFPGNVRELEGMMYDAVVRSEPGKLSISSLLQATGRSSTGQTGEPTEPAGDAEGCFRTLQMLPTLRTAATMLIEEALKRSGNNQAAAAKLLGVTRAALNKRLNRPRKKQP
jgi:DNA-binding NtrC family response regulator